METGLPQHVLDALRRLSRLSHASTIEEAKASLMGALLPFGISYYAAWIAADPTHHDPRTTLISNWPDDWADSYMAGEKYLYDPVVLHAVAQAGSFFWHELSGQPSTRALELKRDAQRYGMIDGFTVSWRSPLPTATILSLAGTSLDWMPLERETATAVADEFISRTMYLRSDTRDHPIRSLSPQERRILYLAAMGLSDNDIAGQLQIKRSTVVTHWARLRSKLGAVDRAQAIALGIRSGEIAF
jgi:DNA-binding CsgD family transcriptional regulator